VSDAVPAATVAFLADLRANNTREWFDAHRTRYERDVLTPAKELVTAVAPLLERLTPGIRAEPRVLGSIFRINRDTRFSADKRPYKDHLDFWFWHGERARAVSGLFLRITPDGAAVGVGAHVLTQQTLHRYRTAVCDPQAGPDLAGILAALAGAGLPVAAPELVRPPSGWSAAPVAAPLLLRRSLFAAVEEPVAFALEPGLAGRLEGRWAPMVPLHEWLVRHVQDR
jgi:uncharacterized protein (TIGR02453 family)